MKLLINLIFVSISFIFGLDSINKSTLNSDINTGVKLSDILQGIEGINVSKNRSVKNLDSIYIRGVKQNNIMLDGVSLNNASNSINMLSYIYPPDLEEIRINKNQNSNNLLGGEVDFITHMPSNLEALVFMGYGDPILYDMAPQNTFRGYASIGDAYFDKKFKIKLSYAWIASRGFHQDRAWTSSSDSQIQGYIPSFGPNGENRFIVGNTSRELYQNHNARFKTNINIGDNGLLDISLHYFNFNYNHNEEQTFLTQNGNPYFGNGTGGTTGSLPYSFVGDIGSGIEHQAIESIKYTHKFRDYQITFKILRFDSINDFVSPDYSATPSGGSGTLHNIYSQKTNIDLVYERDFLNREINFNFGAKYNLIQANISEGGVPDWRNFVGNVKSNLFTKALFQSHLLSIFSSVNTYFLDSNLVFSFGTSLEGWRGIIEENSKKDYKNALFLSPRISLEYKPLSITKLKTSFIYKNEAPEFRDLLIGHTYNDGKKIAPNKNLLPQGLSSFDLGIEQDIPMEGKLKIYYFLQYFNNVIYEDFENNIYANAKNALIHGIEISYKQPLFFNIGFFGSYTFSMLNEKFKIPPIPPHVGYLSLYYEDYGFFGSIGIEFRSKIFGVENVYGSRDKYNLVNIKIGYNFDKNISMSLEGMNIFNYQYFDYQKGNGSEFFINARAKL